MEFNKGKDLDSKIQKSKKSQNYRCAPKVLDFLDLHCVFDVFWILPKKLLLFFFGFSMFLVLAKFEKSKKKHNVVFGIFPVFIEPSRKNLLFF